MMQLKYLFFALFIITVSAGVLLLRVAGSISSRSDTQTYQATIVGETPMQLVGPQTDTGAIVTSSTQRADEPSKPIQDGQSLLKSRCTGCHMIQLLENTTKPRSDWDKVLEKMEGFGVELSDSEKTILLDYLDSGGHQ